MNVQTFIAVVKSQEGRADNIYSMLSHDWKGTDYELLGLLVTV